MIQINPGAENNHLANVAATQDGFYDILRFSTDEGQRDVYDACKAAGEYIDAESIGAVVLIDRSTRPMWAGIRAYHQAHSSSNKPDIFFVDNEGFENLAPDSQVASKFRSEHPYLLRHKDTTTLVLDTCIHQGKASGAVVSGLKAAGFSDVRFGVVSDHDNFSGTQPDVVLIGGEPENSCYPFGQHAITEHDASSLHAKALKDGESLPTAAYVRQRIAEIVRHKGVLTADMAAIEAVTNQVMHHSLRMQERRFTLLHTSVAKRFFYTALGTYWTTTGVELLSDQHVPLVPAVIGSAAVNTAVQTWRHNKQRKLNFLRMFKS